MSHIVFWVVLISLLLSSAQQSAAAETKLAWQIEWEKTIDAAKKESKVVAGVPASAELRKSLEETFAKRFPGVEIEISTGARSDQRQQNRRGTCRRRALL